MEKIIISTDKLLVKFECVVKGEEKHIFAFLDTRGDALILTEINYGSQKEHIVIRHYELYNYGEKNCLEFGFFDEILKLSEDCITDFEDVVFDANFFKTIVCSGEVAAFENICDVFNKKITFI